MADKMTCPACDSRSSTQLADYNQGAPCRYCGLSASAAEAVWKARDHAVAEETVARLIKAEQEAAQLRHENYQLRRIVGEVRGSVTRELTPYLDDLKKGHW